MSAEFRRRLRDDVWRSAADRRKEGDYPHALQRLLELEAAFTILRPIVVDRSEDALRDWIARYTPRLLHGFIAAHLKKYPHRRVQ